MKRKGPMIALTLAAGLALGMLGSQVFGNQHDADEEPIVRAELDNRPLETVENGQGRVVQVQLAPGASFADGPTVTYPAEEFVYIVEGSGTLQREGEEIEVEAGDSIYNGFEEPHNLINTGDETLKVVAVWIGEQGAF